MSETKADYNPANKMIKLSGKAYLQVADRIVWFRNDYPEGTIETSVVSIDEERGSAIFRARVTTGQGGVAEATGSETLKDFPQGWIEKAESKAVGRALGYLGYGTAAAGFEEGNRPGDAPRDIRQQPAPRQQDRRTDYSVNEGTIGGAPKQTDPGHAGSGFSPGPQVVALGAQEHPLLATIRDDTADPKKRKTALHNYFMAAGNLSELTRCGEVVKGSGMPDADLAAAYQWHHERITTGKAPAPKATPLLAHPGAAG